MKRKTEDLDPLELVPAKRTKQFEGTALSKTVGRSATSTQAQKTFIQAAVADSSGQRTTIELGHKQTLNVLDGTAEEPVEPAPAKKTTQSEENALSKAAEQTSTLAGAQKTFIRAAAANVEQLNSMGLSPNQTLNMVNSATGQLENSVKMVEHFQINTNMDVF